MNFPAEWHQTQSDVRPQYRMWAGLQLLLSVGEGRGGLKTASRREADRGGARGLPTDKNKGEKRIGDKLAMCFCFLILFTLVLNDRMSWMAQKRDWFAPTGQAQRHFLQYWIGCGIILLHKRGA